jgi:hypothetical protein
LALGLTLALTLGACVLVEPPQTNDGGAGGTVSTAASGGAGGAGGAGGEMSTGSGIDWPMSAPRVLLHEDFAGSNCGPCKYAEEVVFGVLAANPGRYALLSYQLGSDPYVSREAVKRRMGYLPPEASTYAIPYLHVDGVHGFHPVEVNNDAGYQVTDFASFDTPSPLELAATHAIDGQSLSVSITMRVLTDVLSQNLRLHVAIVENKTSKNIGSNGQTEFHAVMKKMLPDHNGEPIAELTRGQEYTFDRGYTFQGDYTSETGFSNRVNHNVEHTVEEFDDLSAVVFIQDAVTLQVHQSVWTGAGRGASQID